MNKKPRIESKLNISNLKKPAEFVELHVLVANSHAWRPENWQAYERGSSISIGFVKTEVSTSLFELRSTLLQQLRPETLPDQYVYLRVVGRGSTICSSRQERSLKARDFAPPLYAHAEICILSADNMAFHPRMNQNGLLPPVTPVPNRLSANNTAPLHTTSIERSKSPSFRSLQSLEGSSYSMFNNNELMMAEIAFLDAKRALADAHAQALRNQYMHNQSVIIENGLGSEGESDEEEEAEKRRKEEEQRKREEEEEERERIRKEEEEERKRLLEMEEEKRQIEEEMEEEQRKRLQEMEEEKRRIREEREERERQIEEEILAEEEKAKALYDLKRKAAEKKRIEEDNRIAELERAAKEEEEERRRREEEILRKKQEIARRWIEEMLLEDLDKALVHSEEERARLAEEMFKREEQRLKDAAESEDEEMDAAMKLIDDVTQTPRPWHAKEQQRKKIVRVAKEYSKEELEEVAYLRAKIGTYRDHRTTMESKHHDLLQRLSEMEENWDEDERKEFESKWRPKCKDEEIKTPQLYERNRQLRLELQMLYKQADTIISHAQAMKQSDDRKGMAFPSIKNNLRINLQRLQNEVTELRKRTATAQIKYDAEKSNREGVEKEVKQLRQELINSKISSSVSGR